MTAAPPSGRASGEGDVGRDAGQDGLRSLHVAITETAIFLLASLFPAGVFYVQQSSLLLHLAEWLCFS